jgi:hypothetical protein
MFFATAPQRQRRAVVVGVVVCCLALACVATLASAETEMSSSMIQASDSTAIRSKTLDRAHIGSKQHLQRFFNWNWGGDDDEEEEILKAKKKVAPKKKKKATKNWWNFGSWGEDADEDDELQTLKKSNKVLKAAVQKASPKPTPKPTPKPVVQKPASGGFWSGIKDFATRTAQKAGSAFTRATTKIKTAVSNAKKNVQTKLGAVAKAARNWWEDFGGSDDSDSDSYDDSSSESESGGTKTATSGGATSGGSASTTVTCSGDTCKCTSDVGLVQISQGTSSGCDAIGSSSTSNYRALSTAWSGSGWNLNPSCVTHSSCYNMCGANRGVCDSALLTNARAVCAKVLNLVHRQKCNTNAQSLYESTRRSATVAARFVQSQTTLCMCGQKTILDSISATSAPRSSFGGAASSVDRTTSGSSLAPVHATNTGGTSNLLSM